MEGESGIRRLTAVRSCVAGLWAFLPELAFAEVSDKVEGTATIWAVGVIAALMCFAAGRYRRWLLFPLAAIPLAWFVALYFELHSADVGPALMNEQGIGYFVQAYLAGAVFLLGCALGWLAHRRRK